MVCESARDWLVLVAYGELPDEVAPELEQHLAGCPACREELELLRGMSDLLATQPMPDPDPNLLAASRLRLDEALDAMPRHGLWSRLRANGGLWLSHLQSAPALATLLVGAGFLAGDYARIWQIRHQPVPAAPVILSTPNGGGISNISEVKPLPNNMVQVSYNRVVPEMAQGSLDSPQMRALLMVGTHAATTSVVRIDSVSLLAGECRAGHACRPGEDQDIRGALLTSLRADRAPSVRLSALNGLQPYVGEDEAVRDAILRTLMTDGSAAVRSRAIEMLEPVQSDTSVRQALRTVSTTDVNPYIRTVSTQALAGSASLQ